MANLHPFALAVLNSTLRARGLATIPGNEQWFEPAPEPAPEKEDER